MPQGPRLTAQHHWPLVPKDFVTYRSYLSNYQLVYWSFMGSYEVHWFVGFYGFLCLFVGFYEFLWVHMSFYDGEVFALTTLYLTS